RALTQAQVSQTAHVTGLDIRAFVRRGGRQQVDALRRLIALECDRGTNLGELHFIPYGPVGKKLRSLRGELLGPSYIAQQRQRHGRTPQATRCLAIARERVGARVGFLKFGGDTLQPAALSHLRGALVESVRLTALAVNIPIGPLQAKTEVLLG